MTLTHAPDRVSNRETTSEQGRRANQEARRHAQLRDMDENSTDRNASEFLNRLSEQEAAYDAWRVGATHPDDTLFAEIWSGQTKGVSEENARAKVSADRELIRRIGQGEMAYTDIVGWRALGTDQAMVVTNLQKRVELYEEALRCGGRNLSINQLRVAKLKRERG